MKPLESSLRSGFLLAIAVVLGLGPVAGRAAGDESVAYRQSVMKTLDEQASALFMILQGKASPEDLASQARALAIASKQVEMAFRTRADGGRAKPEVWTNWQDFSSRATAQAQKLAEFEKVAARDGLAAAAGLAKESFSCKSCHDTYRVAK